MDRLVTSSRLLQPPSTDDKDGNKETRALADRSGNAAGALVTGLAPTATALAVYFCFSDLVLITQSLYYNTLSARRAARERTRSSDSEGSEEEPLLRRRRTSSVGLPGSRRRHSFHREESGFDPITRIVTGEDDVPDSNPWLHNSLSIAAVHLIGALGWFVSYKAGAWDGPETPGAPAPMSTIAKVGIALGYASALCYLCARIPQIIKNYRDKSCEGMSYSLGETSLPCLVAVLLMLCLQVLPCCSSCCPS
jgi:solute carrier family 66 (lysosomal lysine-arginine transporter), member 1